jgi:methionyl-tRNA formyltransferase
VLPSIINHSNKRTTQNNDEATYGYNIKREDEQIDFNKKGTDIYNLVRGLNPWPLANFVLDEKEIKVLKCYFEEKNVTGVNGQIVEIRKDAIGIKCSDGIIYLTRIKPFGKKEMVVADYLNGVKKENLLNASFSL